MSRSTGSPGGGNDPTSADLWAVDDGRGGRAGRRRQDGRPGGKRNGRNWRTGSEAEKGEGGNGKARRVMSSSPPLQRSDVFAPLVPFAIVNPNSRMIPVGEFGMSHENQVSRSPHNRMHMPN